MLGYAPALSVAGRTDPGVHARGQVVSFAAEEAPEPGALLRSLNGVLPHDVAVVAGRAGARRVRRAPGRALADLLLPACSRGPRPSPFERDRALWWPHPLDEDALDACARGAARHARLHRLHADADRPRALRARCAAGRVAPRRSRLLEFWIEADTFMRHMVRVLVGTMLEVGAGRRDPASFARLLEGAPRASAGQTAEPHGLCLESVSY